ALDHFVVRRPAAVAGGPFLQRAFWMLGAAGPAFDCRLPQLYHDVARRVEAGFHEVGSEQRLHDVTEDVVAVGGAVVPRLFAEPDLLRRADLTRDRRAGLAADQSVEPLGQFALAAA